MKGKISKKLVVLIATVLMLSTALISTGFAADNFVNVKGFFSSVIQIFNEGELVSLGTDSTGKEIKPFVMNETTYLPIRALSNALGKEITWDGGTNRINIIDKNLQDVNYLLQQIVQKQDEVKTLQAKVTELEAKIKVQEETPKTTVKDLEKYLNKEYGSYKKNYFDISLSGDKDKIKVMITANSYDYNSRWDSLTNSEIKSYVAEIVDDIRRDFKDVSITGYIEDNYRHRNFVTFSMSSRGSLSVDIDYDYGYDNNNGYYNLSEIERNLNNRYYGYVNNSLNIRLYEDNYRGIQVYITADQYDWYSLSSTTKKQILDGITYDLNREYGYSGISGIVQDRATGTTIDNF